MKRIVLIVAVAALCVAGSAVAQDGGLIGSGTRSGDSGQVVGSGYLVSSDEVTFVITNIISAYL